MPYLVCRKTDGSGIDHWEVGEKPLIFGRGTSADVRISDERVSRQHFAVVFKDGGYVLQDLKSTNGTWLNDERIVEATLKPNDMIRAGQTVFAFTMERPKGLATVISELEKEGAGLQTFISQISTQPPAPPA
jgi:pSer/pThr/pTyr-binding forkhead associated (FHA) protein